MLNPPSRAWPPGTVTRSRVGGTPARAASRAPIESGRLRSEIAITGPPAGTAWGGTTRWAIESRPRSCCTRSQRSRAALPTDATSGSRPAGSARTAGAGSARPATRTRVAPSRRSGPRMRHPVRREGHEPAKHQEPREVAEGGDSDGCDQSPGRAGQFAEGAVPRLRHRRGGGILETAPEPAQRFAPEPPPGVGEEGTVGRGPENAGRDAG